MFFFTATVAWVILASPCYITEILLKVVEGLKSGLKLKDDQASFSFFTNLSSSFHHIGWWTGWGVPAISVEV